jgi:rubrerythrin
LRELAKWLRQRVKAEQVAVTQCMRLAQKARDELTRALLRQVASDSLRHAEIVASLAPYIDRGVSSAFASGITRKEIEALIEGERKAEAQADSASTRHLRGTMAILIASMEADERKHAELLRGLLDTGFRN